MINKLRKIRIILRRGKVEAGQLRRSTRSFGLFPHWRDKLEEVKKIVRDQGIPENPDIGDLSLIVGHVIPYELSSAVHDYLEWLGWVTYRHFGDVGGYGLYICYGMLPKSEKS